MKKKSILKGASFFLATFAFCGVMALGAKYISPRHEVNTAIETQVAYADEATSVIDKTAWDSFKETYKNDILNVTSVVTSLSAPQTLGTINESIGTNARVDVNGTVMTFYSTDGTKIFLPADCSYFFYKYYNGYIFRNVTTIDLSNFNTSNVTNMSRMFGYCPALTSLDLSGFNTTNVTNMSWMFYLCQALTNITFGSNFDTTNVTNMSRMFGYCQALTSLDLSGFNTTNVTDMSYMFYLCQALTSLDISGFDTSKVTNMAEMFCACGNLKEVDISNFITSQVTDIHVMFYGCNSLKVVDLSSFDLTNVNTNQLFDGCENLSMIYLPKALPQGYDVELGSDLVLASNHAVKGSTLNAFAGYESTAGQKNAIVKGGEVNVVVDTQFADVISTGEEIEYYYGDEIVVNGTTLIIGGVSVQVIPNEVEGYEITFDGWEGVENGVVVGDTITAILTKTPINYTITMIVNGQNNTRTYNIETNTFTLEEPEGGEEEEFVGWTWEGQEVPVKDLEILKGSIGDRTVKANFAPKTYTITINVDGEITTIDYTKGSDDIVIKDPSSSGLIFDGWVDENGNKVDENVIKSGSTGDRYFKATWKKSPMLKYVAIGVLSFVGVAVATEIIVGVLVKKKKK